MIIPVQVARLASSCLEFSAVVAEACEAGHLGGDLVRRGGAVDPAQDALVVEELDQRLGLLVVGLEPVADHVGLVVVADQQLAAVDVADTLALGRVEIGVEDVSRLGAGAAPAQPPRDHIVGSIDQEDSGEAAAELAHLRLERLGLGNGAGEAVEDEAVGGLVGVDPLGDRADDHLVGD